MEDLLEQLVGDIWDEDEEVENKFKKTSENEYEISGDMNISDMLELIEKSDKYIETDSKSVGGWVTELAGDIPKTGASLKYRELEIVVGEVDEQRVSSVFLSFTAEKSEDGE